MQEVDGKYTQSFYLKLRYKRGVDILKYNGEH